MFGSKALAYIPHEKRDKWDTKAQELIFVGYDENIKGYRLIDPKTKKITVSRDVIFQEDYSNDISEEKKGSREATIYQVDKDLSKEQVSDTDLSDEEDEENTDIFLEADKNQREDREPVQESRAVRGVEQRAQSKEITLRRSERKWKPSVKHGYVSYMAAEKNSDEPATMEEVMVSAERENWVKAMQEEIHLLQKNNTWEEVDRPLGVKPLTVKWVYKRKKTDSGNIRYKARLVAKGCSQIEERDYEVFSPIIRYKTISYLLAKAARYKWIIHHMDVVTAYLNSELKEETYLIPPKDIFEADKTEKIWKLNKAM